MKATFATFDFGYKNLLKIERPTSAKCHFTNQKKQKPEKYQKTQIDKDDKTCLHSSLDGTELHAHFPF